MGLKKYDAEAEKLKKLEAEKATNTEEDEELDEESDEHELEEIESGSVAELSDTEQKVSDIVNSHKKQYVAYMKKQKIINSIISAVVLVICIGSMAMIFTKDLLDKAAGLTGLGMGLGLTLIAIAFITLFVSGKILKKQRTEEALDYVDNLYEATNKFIYSNTEFSNLECKPRYQYNLEDFQKAHLYKDVKATRSRNYCEVTYKDKLLTSADLAANVLIKNRTSPMFLGKYYEYPCNYEGETFILFQLKGKELSRPIDDVDNLKLVEGNKKYNIYSNDENWHKVLNDKVLSELRTFRIDSTLIDVILSIRNGKVSLGIDYADEFMEIPVESEFNFENVRKTKKDLEKVLRIFDLLNR